MREKITVTSSSLPDFKEFTPFLEDIWRNKWLINQGQYHEELESVLREYLGVNHYPCTTN